LSIWFIDRLRQTKIDNFCRDYAVVFQIDHDVTRFDVPVNAVLLVHRSKSGGDLHHNFQRELHFDPPQASDKMLKSALILALYRVPRQTLRIPLSRPQASFSGD